MHAHSHPGPKFFTDEPEKRLSNARAMIMTAESCTPHHTYALSLGSWSCTVIPIPSTQRAIAVNCSFELEDPGLPVPLRRHLVLLHLHL